MLEHLIQQANISEPNLAQKLIALAKWIADKKDGLLMNKPYVLDLLTEILRDAEFWLAIQSLSEDEKNQFYESDDVSVAEQYWFDVLFPRWINAPDPHFPNWRREVMHGNFRRDDESTLRNLTQEIERHNGHCLWNHLLDLSMATDLLVSGQKGHPLCVQLTTVSERYLTNKKQSWGNTLKHWNIQWGLLLSYNSTANDLITKLVTVILSYSNEPIASCYTVITDLEEACHD